MRHNRVGLERRPCKRLGPTVGGLGPGVRRAPENSRDVSGSVKGALVGRESSDRYESQGSRWRGTVGDGAEVWRLRCERPRREVRRRFPPKNVVWRLHRRAYLRWNESNGLPGLATGESGVRTYGPGKGWRGR